MTQDTKERVFQTVINHNLNDCIRTLSTEEGSTPENVKNAYIRNIMSVITLKMLLVCVQCSTSYKYIRNYF